MNKTDLINFVAESVEDLTKKKAGEIVDAVLDGILHGLSKGEDVSLVGYGTWKIVDVPEREHSNPKTGEKVIKPAHRKVKFKTGSYLNAVVN